MSFLQLIGMASCVVYALGVVFHVALLLSAQLELRRYRDFIGLDSRPALWEYPLFASLCLVWPLVKIYAAGEKLVASVRGHRG